LLRLARDLQEVHWFEEVPEQEAHEKWQGWLRQFPKLSKTKPELHWHVLVPVSPAFALQEVQNVELPEQVLQELEQVWQFPSEPMKKPGKHVHWPEFKMALDLQVWH
jgi:hypothetical protein